MKQTNCAKQLEWLNNFQESKKGPRIAGAFWFTIGEVKFKLPQLKFKLFSRKSATNSRVDFRSQNPLPKPQKSVVQQKGHAFRQQREQQKRQERLRDVVETLKRYRLVIFGALAVLLLIVIFAVISAILRANNTFIVKTVTVRGNQALTSEEIIAAIPEVQNQTMLAISARGVEQKLLKQFPYLKEVYVRKFLPDRLEIEVKERFPIMIYANLGAAISVDDEGVVLNVFSDENVAELSTEELEIIVGYGDPNANRVKEKYLASLQTEDERQKTKWEEVKPEDKQKALNDLRGDYVVRFETQIRKTTNSIPENLRNSLPLLQDIASRTYKIGDHFSSFKFTAARKVHAYFSQIGMVPTRFLWQTDFNIVVTLPSSIQVIFTTSRAIDDQIVAFETLRKQIGLNGTRVVDVRATVISVR